MKVNELTEGIYVYFNCFDGSKITVKVTGFNDGIVYGVSEYGTHWCQISKIEPIPLTPEILEKNGFENLDGHYWLNPSYESHINIIFFKGFIELDVRNYHSTLKDENGNYDVSTYDRKYTNVLYAHQLQHALRLCEIDKTIEL